MEQRKFDSLLRSAVGIPVIALAVFAVLLLWEIQSLKSSLGKLDHSDQVISADNELMRLTVDMESGVRGYLSTGSDEFLQPYANAAPTIDPKFASLHQLVSGQGAQQIRLDTIQSCTDRWRLLAERAVHLHRTDTENGKFQPSTEANNLQLKQLMDLIRTQHEAFIATEMQLRDISARRARAYSRLALTTCAMLALMGGGILALFTRRQMRSLERNFKASLETLEAHAESLREKGQLLDLAYDAILVHNRDGTIRFWNHGAEDIYGYSRVQATGQTSQTLLHTVFPEPQADIQEKLLRDGRWEGELTRTVQDGTRVMVASRWTLWRDKDGQAFGAMEISSDITARKKSEEDLRERELLLRTVAEQTDIGLVVLREDRRYLYTNHAHAEILGLSIEQIVGKSLVEVMGDSYNKISAQLDKAFAGAQVDFETKGPTRSGTGDQNGARSYAITYKPLKRPGEGTRVIAVILDITERKQAEEALRTSQEHLSAIIRMAMDGVITLDATQHIILFNTAAERIFGCPASEAIGQSLDRFIPVQVRDDRANHGQDAGSTGKAALSTHHSEMFRGLNTNYGLRVNGQKFPLEATISQIALAGERLYTVILRDITQRKQAEEELIEKEQQFHSMFEHAAVGITQVDMDGAYIRVNPAMCEMLGYSEAELLSKTSESITHPLDWESERALLESMLSGGRDFYEVEKRYLHRSGATIWVSVTSSLVKDMTKRPLYRITVVQNITRRKRAEDQLQQAQKMEGIGRLAGGIAHDFNNLLTVILGNSELALAELPDNAPNRARFQEIQASGQTAAALTRQLLAFSRKQVIRKRVVDLKEIVVDMGQMLRRLLPEDIEIVIHCSQEACPVEADPNQLKQVLMNLVVNAGDAMPKGGNLTIDVRTVTLDDEVQQDAELERGPCEMLTVSDTGSGMDTDTVAHIFEPFFTTKPVGKGTGLGLSTLYGIVHQCGGTVLVSSKPGAGSTFRVCLPRSLEGIETKAAVGSILPILSGNETVLLVDDSAPLRKLMLELLSRQGYTVLEAADGILALEVSKNYPGIIHLLITDMVMPRMGGIELAKCIVQDRPDIALIFVTGYAAETCVMPHHPTGRTTIVEKPYKTATLLHAVRRMLDEMEATVANK
jgi:PAS domain S-box-containing protein